MKLQAKSVFVTLILKVDFGLLLKARVDQELYSDIISLIYLEPAPVSLVLVTLTFLTGLTH